MAPLIINKTYITIVSLIKILNHENYPVLETIETQINLSALKSGIYILKAIIEGNILTKKVIR